MVTRRSRDAGEGTAVSTSVPRSEVMTTFAPAIDVAMDRLIVPGYSRFGYAVRRPHWDNDPPPAVLDGKIALVTGANSGLGKATVAGLARLGATVHMLVRNRERGERARTEIAAEVPGAQLLLEQCDVGRMAAVRAFVSDFAARRPELHFVAHNAGVMPPERTETDEDNELTFATHVLGPFLLNGLLRDVLRAGAPGRVVYVSSGGMYAQPLRSDDPQYSRSEYSPAAAYARTKRMQVVLAEEWARELRDDHVAVHSMHPGWVETPGIAQSMPRFHRLTARVLRTPAEGADTLVWLSAAEEAGEATGLFWHDRVLRPTHYFPWTRETDQQRQRLWETCERLTGLADIRTS